jgi:hypothetical protein
VGDGEFGGGAHGCGARGGCRVCVAVGRGLVVIGVVVGEVVAVGVEELV